MANASDTSSALDTSSPLLTWTNVFIAFFFIVFDATLSRVFQLNIGTSLIISSFRCVIQLTLMGLVLGSVFASDSVIAIFGIILLLNMLGAIEVTYNKAKGRFSNMFVLVLVSTLSATIPITVIGCKFAMSVTPFYKPDQYIPISGMILGNSISAIGVGWATIQKEFTANGDKIEVYLAMGATRFEAVRPIGVEALRLALLPTINQMSVIGLIAIPGMMTGAIVGGKSVEQAAKLQMIIIFMIAASSALSTLISLYFACTTLIDDRHRIRLDRIEHSKPWIYETRDRVVQQAWSRMTDPFKATGRPRQAGSTVEALGLLDRQARGAN